MVLKRGVRMFEILTTMDLGSLVGERHAVARWSQLLLQILAVV